MKWISIETPPELVNKNPYGDFSDEVIFLTNEGAIQGRLYKDGSFSFISLDIHGCGCCGKDTDTVTHWMPIPQLDI